MAERPGEPEDHDFRAGLPGYHDPTAGIGGAAPARSALTLRLVLAAFGLAGCAGLAIWLSATDGPIVLIIVLVILGVIAVIDLGVVALAQATRRARLRGWSMSLGQLPCWRRIFSRRL